MAQDKKSALIMVDVQNDFCPGGALAVEEGDQVVPVLNRYAERFAAEGEPIFATRDWHPRNHLSFQERGGPWPVHCVKESEGAAFHPDLRFPAGTTVVSKGYEPNQEAYSGFLGTELAEQLRERGVERLYIGGLALDICVKNTVLDAVKEGFDTYLLEDASRGVDVNPGDVEKAKRQMEEAGAKRITYDQLDL